MSLADIKVVINPDSSQREALQTALRAISGLLAADYDPQFIDRQQAAQSILGQWLSLMPGREAEHWRDVEQFAQDLVLQIQIGAHRTLVSDSLCLFLGGIMPSYSRAKVLAGMLADLRPAREVEGYFHSMGYGSVKAFIEARGPGSKALAQSKLKALLNVFQQEDRRLHAIAMQDNTVLLAQALPQPLPPTRFDVPPANDPAMPRNAPNLRLIPGGAGEALGAGRLATLIALPPEIIVGAIFTLVPSSIDADGNDEEWLKERAEQEAKDQQIVIAATQTLTEAASNASNSECQPQIKDNQKNGAKCENDGYTLMEEVLKYQRLADPPKGKGLDGLFEKRPPLMSPDPMPEFVQLLVGTETKLAPGFLIFIPQTHRPPKPSYDYASKVKGSVYPKFVVFEAKNIDKTFDRQRPADIQDEARRRLGNTCDGVQMTTKWTEDRIPRALGRSTSLSEKEKKDKLGDITEYEYARWIFCCLSGAVGSSKKLYVLIDVVASGMEKKIDTVEPRVRKSRSPKSTSTSDTF